MVHPLRVQQLGPGCLLAGLVERHSGCPYGLKHPHEIHVGATTKPRLALPREARLHDHSGRTTDLLGHLAGKAEVRNDASEVPEG